jgi:hypothetical protein
VKKLIVAAEVAKADPEMLGLWAAPVAMAALRWGR